MTIDEIKQNVFFSSVYIKGSPTIDFGIYYSTDIQNSFFSISDNIKEKIGKSDVYFSEYKYQNTGFWIFSCLTKNFSCIIEIINIILSKKTRISVNKIMFVLTGNYTIVQKDILFNLFNHMEIMVVNSKIDIQNKLSKKSSKTNKKNELSLKKALQTNWKREQVAYVSQSIILLKIVFEFEACKNDLFCADILAGIVGLGDGSRLGMILREKYAYTDEVWPSVYVIKDEKLCIAFNLYTKMKWVEKIVQLSWNILKKIPYTLTQQELKTEQVNSINGLCRMVDDTFSTNQYLGNNFLYNADFGYDIEYQKEMYSQVKLYQLQKLAAKGFKTRNGKISYMKS